MPRRPQFHWKRHFFIALILGAFFILTETPIAYGKPNAIFTVTNLNDAFPWGLWVGFDILCGVGLAAGGFAITSLVYVFNVKRFQPIVRPTVLTAFLGYVLVVVALFFDLGRPWNLWRPLVFWNPRSVMFEVSWCVMLYLTVLFLEFSGMVFERLGWTRALVIQHAATVPLVIAGTVLSTLHQSSLGSFYLIVPAKLHALWYSPLLPVHFFLSALAVGGDMVNVESRLSSRGRSSWTSAARWRWPSAWLAACASSIWRGGARSGRPWPPPVRRRSSSSSSPWA
jgi:Ni/Fe-hydrogenase subunit HybB-like protein